MSKSDPKSPSGPALVRTLDAHLDDSQRERFIAWAQRLLEIRETRAPAVWKAKQALRATREARVVAPVLTSVGEEVKRVAWDDRGWSARLGLGAAITTAAVAGGQGAGIAALGTAVGVPLWVVLGAGGTFAGALVDELQRSLNRPRSGPVADPVQQEEETPLELIDADWEVVEETLLPGESPASHPTAQEPAAPDRFRQLLRRARSSLSVPWQRKDGEEQRTEDPSGPP